MLQAHLGKEPLSARPHPGCLRHLSSLDATPAVMAKGGLQLPSGLPEAAVVGDLEVAVVGRWGGKKLWGAWSVPSHCRDGLNAEMIQSRAASASDPLHPAVPCRGTHQRVFQQGHRWSISSLPSLRIPCHPRNRDCSRECVCIYIIYNICLSFFIYLFMRCDPVSLVLCL